MTTTNTSTNTPHGRWFWGEDTQLRRMYKKLDVPALKSIAARSVGTRECVAMTKFLKSGSGKAFRLEMDNGATAMAKVRVPFPGPAFVPTASEVATTDFVSSILGIPTPEVLAWSATADNAIESGYIYHSKSARDTVDRRMLPMELEQRLQIAYGIIALEKKMMSASLNRYGSIYFSGDAFERCEMAHIETNITAAK